MRLIAYADKIANETHLALVKGEPTPDKEVLVRVHEPLSVFDLLDSASRTHSWNTLKAMETIQHADCGVIVLLHRNEDGAQLIERIRHADEPIRSKQDLRDYGIGSQILLDLGVRKMRLMAVQRKMPSMAGFGLEITGYLEANIKRLWLRTLLRGAHPSPYTPYCLGFCAPCALNCPSLASFNLSPST